MDHVVLKARTRKFALQAMQLVETIPRGLTADVLSRQLLRSATSVGANYRAACRAKSRADFISKLKIVEEEADECVYWCELLRDGELGSPEQVRHLMAEGRELTAIVVASIKTARSHSAKAN